MSQPERVEPDSDPPVLPNPASEEEINVENVIHSFLAVFPQPTEEQIHRFAYLIDMSPEVFEEQIYHMFGERDDEDTEDEEILDDDPEDDDEDSDPMELFILMYFMYNREPTDDQVLHLAELLDCTTEELENYLYTMLSDINGENDFSDSGLIGLSDATNLGPDGVPMGDTFTVPDSELFLDDNDDLDYEEEMDEDELLDVPKEPVPDVDTTDLPQAPETD